jgi:hypothetical protein
MALLVASIMWIIANKFLKEESEPLDVEWAYSFDVHLNAFFPPLIILHFIQLIFYNALFSQDWFAARFLGNTLWLLAFGYYIYISFLGYNSEFMIFRFFPAFKLFYHFRYQTLEAIQNPLHFSLFANCLPVLHYDSFDWMEFEQYADELLPLSGSIN